MPSNGGLAMNGMDTVTRHVMGSCSGVKCQVEVNVSLIRQFLRFIGTLMWVWIKVRKVEIYKFCILID